MSPKRALPPLRNFGFRLRFPPRSEHRQEVTRDVWAGLGNMSAALLRRGLELLAASEGEEGWPWDFALCGRPRGK